MSDQTEKELIKSDILGKELFTDSDIKNRISELGLEITRDYKYKNLLLVSILRGGVIFLADLIKEIDLPLSIDFMSISKYGIDDTSTGVVRIINPVLRNTHEIYTKRKIDFLDKIC